MLSKRTAAGVLLAAVAVFLALAATTRINWITQVNNKPFADSRQYNFAAQTPGGSLSVGANTVTLAPVPAGVNGADTNHYLYLSGGTGTAEAVLITGGTATSGSSSGTVTFTAANTHSGAWTIASATAGIQEALDAGNPATAGTHILVPAGTTTIYATITPPTGSTVEGAAGPTLYPDTGAQMTRLSFQSTTTKLFNIVKDTVALRHMMLSQDAGTATSGSIGVFASGISPNGSMGVTLEDISAIYFYVGFQLDGNNLATIKDSLASSNKSDGFLLKGAQGFLYNCTSEFNAGNGFNLEPPTSGTTYSPQMDLVQTYNNGGWGIYAAYYLQLTNFFLNGDAQGELYSSYNSNISGGVAEVSGAASGFTNSNTAPGIYLAPSGTNSAVANVQIASTQGIGLYVGQQYALLSNVLIASAGIGAQAGNLYGLEAYANFGSYSNVVVASSPSKIVGTADTVIGSRFTYNSISIPVVELSTGTDMIFANNWIYAYSAGGALTIDSGVTYTGGQNNISGAIANSGSLDARNADINASAAWTALSYANSWVDFSSPYAASGSRLDSSGNVWIKLAAKAGTYTAGTTVFTLPAGQRPAATVDVTTACASGTTWSTCTLQITNTGTANLYGAAGNTFLGSNNMSFPLN